MIGVTDVANIIYRDCQRFGLRVIPFGEVITGEVRSDRIVILPKRRSDEKYWEKGFVEVNFITADLRTNTANMIRLQELERMAMSLEGVGEMNGATYRYGVESIGVEQDVGLRASFVNARILFEVLNVM